MTRTGRAHLYRVYQHHYLNPPQRRTQAFLLLTTIGLWVFSSFVGATLSMDENGNFPEKDIKFHHFYGMYESQTTAHRLHMESLLDGMHTAFLCLMQPLFPENYYLDLIYEILNYIFTIMRIGKFYYLIEVGLNGGRYYCLSFTTRDQHKFFAGDDGMYDAICHWMGLSGRFALIHLAFFTLRLTYMGLKQYFGIVDTTFEEEMDEELKEDLRHAQSILERQKQEIDESAKLRNRIFSLREMQKSELLSKAIEMKRNKSH